MPPQPHTSTSSEATSGAMSYATVDDLVDVRAFVRSRALALGLPTGRAELLVLAVNELTTNTVQHTTGGGRVRVWGEPGQVVCDVVDRGPARPFGRGMPAADAVRGRGLAIVERISDELTTGRDGEGTRVRLRLNLPRPRPA
jgi:serine/threonine-protein kinase RsbW